MGRGGWKWGWDKLDKRDKWPSTIAASPLLPQRPPYRRPFPSSAAVALYAQGGRALQRFVERPIFGLARRKLIQKYRALRALNDRL